MAKYVAIGAKWIDKVNGNTYHNTKVINCETGVVFYTGYEYGYGSSYYHDACRAVENIDPGSVVIDGGAFHLTKREVKNGWF